MSLETVNDSIFFPHAANWRQLPRGQRNWSTGIETALDGSEERQALRGSPTQALAFRVDPFDLKERALLEERILAALKTGKAACPHLGKSSVISSDVVSVNLELEATEWPWAIDDFIFFHSGELGEDTWEVRQIVGQVGGIWILDQAPAETYAAGLQVWPIFFGSLRVNNLQAVTSHRGTIELTFIDPVDVVEAAADDCSGGGEVFPVLLRVDQNSCGSVTLRWNRSINASSYQVKVSDDVGGPYDLVDTVTTHSLSIDQPAFRPKYYIVIATRGALESEHSNEVAIVALSVEREMRAIQERYRAGLNLSTDAGAGGDWIVWPNRVSDAAAPGKYPVEGFYDADLFPVADLDPDAAVIKVQALADALSGTWLWNYATVTDWSDLAAIPVHSNTDVGTVDRRTRTNSMPQLTATLGNYETVLRTIQTRICQLTTLIIQATPTDFARKGLTAGTGNFASPGAPDPELNPDNGPEITAPYAQLRQDVADCVNAHLLATNWGDGRAYGGLFGNYLVELFYYEICELVPEPWSTYGGSSSGPIEGGQGNEWVVWYTTTMLDHAGRRAFSYTTRGKVAVDLSNQLFGATDLYYFTNNDRLTATGGVYSNAFADLAARPVIGTDWTSATYVLGSDVLDPAQVLNGSVTWQLMDQVAQVRKSSSARDGHWSYYP